MCPCSNINKENRWGYLKALNLTKEETQKIMDDYLAELTKEMSVDKKSTKAFEGSLISADDDRPSSKAVGIVGILIICIVLGLIVLSDILRFFMS